MSDDSGVISGLASAAQSLRDTAKWITSGVIGTAAGIAVGTSLTNLGAINLSSDLWRLELAVGSLLAGLLFIAIIFYLALKVFDRGSFTMQELVDGQVLDASAVEALELRYRDWIPTAVKTLSAYAQEIQLVSGILTTSRQQNEETFLAVARQHGDVIAADAALMFVHQRYDKLTRWLGPLTFLAMLCFGLFAWAANPPKPAGDPQSFTLTCGSMAKEMCEKLLNH